MLVFWGRIQAGERNWGVDISSPMLFEANAELDADLALSPLGGWRCKVGLLCECAMPMLFTFSYAPARVPENF